MDVADRILVEIGLRVKAAREAVGLSQSKAAEKAAAGFRWWQRLEHGKMNPTVRTLDRIARALSVSFWDLVARDPPKPAKPVKPARK